MADWIAFREAKCLSKPGIVSFRVLGRNQGDEGRAYNYNRIDLFARGEDDALWHLGGRLGYESLIIGCISNPLVLATNAQDRRPAILDVFTIDRDRMLWHRRFSPPPEGYFLREAEAGCLMLMLYSILGNQQLARFYPTGMWTSLGGPWDSNPAGVAFGEGSLCVAIRRGEEVFLRRYLGNARRWESEWRPMLGAGWVSDPVVNYKGTTGETQIYTVHFEGELYMYTISGSSWEMNGSSPLGVETPLGNGRDGFEQLPPAVERSTIFALARNGQLKYRDMAQDNQWHILGDENRRWSTAPVTLTWQKSTRDSRQKTYVFVRDDVNDLWFTYKPLRGIWSEWENLGGRDTTELSVVPYLDNLFFYSRGRGSDNRLWHTTLNPH